MALKLTLNGQPREFTGLPIAASVQDLVDHLELKSDRVALEHNGVIVPRTSWSQTKIDSGDRLELVHFVGGG